MNLQYEYAQVKPFSLCKCMQRVHVVPPELDAAFFGVPVLAK
jgi:hypothetical protein